MNQNDNKNTKSTSKTLAITADCRYKISKYFRNYARNASIDGLKFLGERKRSLNERIFWSVVILVALNFSAVLIYQTYAKWKNFPVVVSFATRQISLSEIPFPAVTICPQNKYYKDVFNYTHCYIKAVRNESMSEKERTLLDALSLICSPYQIYNTSLRYAENSVVDNIIKLAPKLDEVMLEAYWKGEIITNLSLYFSPVITSDGICYTFNGMDKSEIFTEHVFYPDGFYSSDGKKSKWSIEAGYEDDFEINTFPRRTFLDGVKGGLSLVLSTIHSNIDYGCGEYVQGYKVAFHHPFEIPRLKQNFVWVPLDQYLVAAIKPKMLVTSENLRSYSPEDRKCYFQHERQLRFFKVYNQQNCLIECLSNFTYNSCGCANFNMPQNVSTPICGIGSMECMEMAKVRFMETERKLMKNEIYDHETCNCMPSCFSLDFDVELSQNDWDWKSNLDAIRRMGVLTSEINKIFLQQKGKHFTELQIYFKNMQFLISERNELYGYSEFWANIGGVIGLFTGFSFITAFEILYYLTLRLICSFHYIYSN